MRVLVAQIGARRHYAVPQAFAAVGLLHRFCTDIYLESQASRTLLTKFGKIFKSNAAGRLAGRGTTVLQEELIRTFPYFGLAYKWRVRRSKTFEERVSAWIQGGRRFCQLVIREVDDECDTLYAFSSAALELFQYGRENERRCCLDHATAPLHVEMSLVREEAERFKDWSLMPVDENGMDDYRERQQLECQMADMVFCGSSFARRLLEAEGVPGERIETVPLAVSGNVYGKTNPRKNDGPLRVLFVGDDGLRKGIGYLARAIEMLNSRHFETRVVGNLGITQSGISELSRKLELLGPVPRTEVGPLYQWADVLVLPSVSDTFGIVILEAMASGLPVITTPNTGGPDVIREGVDGFIVPIRDPGSIAERLELLASDAEILSTMSRSSEQRARDYSLAKYSERLVRAATPK